MLYCLKFKNIKFSEEYNVVEFFDRCLKRLKMLINIDIKQVTWNKYYYIKNDVKSFIKWKYKTNDYPWFKITGLVYEG